MASQHRVGDDKRFFFAPRPAPLFRKKGRVIPEIKNNTRRRAANSPFLYPQKSELCSPSSRTRPMRHFTEHGTLLGIGRVKTPVRLRRSELHVLDKVRNSSGTTGYPPVLFSPYTLDKRRADNNAPPRLPGAARCVYTINVRNRLFPKTTGRGGGYHYRRRLQPLRVQ